MKNEIEKYVITVCEIVGETVSTKCNTQNIENKKHEKLEMGRRENSTVIVAVTTKRQNLSFFQKRL